MNRTCSDFYSGIRASTLDEARILSFSHDKISSILKCLNHYISRREETGARRSSEDDVHYLRRGMIKFCAQFSMIFALLGFTGLRLIRNAGEMIFPPCSWSQLMRMSPAYILYSRSYRWSPRPMAAQGSHLSCVSLQTSSVHFRIILWSCPCQ